MESKELRKRTLCFIGTGDSCSVGLLIIHTENAKKGLTVNGLLHILPFLCCNMIQFTVWKMETSPEVVNEFIEE